MRECEVSTPVIGITMGDAAGIGPEIIVQALAKPELYALCRPVVLGDARVLERARRVVGFRGEIVRLRSVAQAEFQPGRIDCLACGSLPADLAWGRVSAAAGEASVRFVCRAVELARAGEIQAICTAPINKLSVREAGHPFPGHTELLAHLTGVQDFAMMMCAPELRVILVTVHLGLVEAVAQITPAQVHRVIRLADAVMKRIRIAHPRIAVCGLNPHAGEGGLFGDREEERKILPAVERALQEGINAVGPLPADSVFHRARQGNFDIVVAMYHDQGLIPVKTLAMESAVNVTVGLPVIRTSVDHGTAFDIAGQGQADARNMESAIRFAAALAGTNS